MLGSDSFQFAYAEAYKEEHFHSNICDPTIQDVVLTTDIKLDSAVTANTKFEFGPKKYTIGATWNGKLANKASTLKAFYSDKDNLVAGEATVSVNKAQKANVTFNQNQVSMHAVRLGP